MLKSLKVSATCTCKNMFIFLACLYQHLVFHGYWVSDPNMSFGKRENSWHVPKNPLPADNFKKYKKKHTPNNNEIL